MALNWQELLRSAPHEIIISGPKHSSQIEEEKGLNDIIFRMHSLNFMEVSKTSLHCLSDKITGLENLTALMLYDNKLTSLPKGIGKLKKLKTLDISNNQIKDLPTDLSQLTELQSFNMINNQISSMPKDLSNWTNLLVIKFSHNKFEKFPSLCNPALRQHLSEIHGTNNQLTDIPDEIGLLSALKIFDLSNNKITYVPGELGDCSKIKTLSLQGNPIKDNRLLKLVERNPTKQIMQYIAKSSARGVGAANKKANIKKEIDESSGDNTQNDNIELSATKQTEPVAPASLPPRRKNDPALIGIIEILAVASDNWFIINADSAILEERKIVACIVRNLNLLDDKVLKKFISLQTTLHETVCGRRELATIATHDLSKIAPRIKLTKMLPHKIRIEPLNRGGKVMSGSELYKTLNNEAEAYRKEKKRSNYSGIHRYLYLLKDKTHYPVVVDANSVVITLPPLTNGESTKITTATRDILIEVTGSKTPNCKKALDTLLHDMLKMELDASGPDPQSGLPKLKVEPVRVVRSDEEDKLFVVYPSKVDLVLDDITIARNFNG